MGAGVNTGVGLGVGSGVFGLMRVVDGFGLGVGEISFFFNSPTSFFKSSISDNRSGVEEANGEATTSWIFGFDHLLKALQVSGFHQAANAICGTIKRPIMESNKTFGRYLFIIS